MMTYIVSIGAFALLFAVYGWARPKAGCGGSCGGCSKSCSTGQGGSEHD